MPQEWPKNGKKTKKEDPEHGRRVERRIASLLAVCLLDLCVQAAPVLLPQGQPPWEPFAGGLHLTSSSAWALVGKLHSGE